MGTITIIMLVRVLIYKNLWSYLVDYEIPRNEIAGHSVKVLIGYL